MTILGIVSLWQIAIILLFFIAIPVVIVVLILKAARKNKATTTSCPHCGGTVAVSAQKRRHCGEWLAK